MVEPIVYELRGVIKELPGKHVLPSRNFFLICNLKHLSSFPRLFSLPPDFSFSCLQLNGYLLQKTLNVVVNYTHNAPLPYPSSVSQ